MIERTVLTTSVSNIESKITTALDKEPNNNELVNKGPLRNDHTQEISADQLQEIIKKLNDFVKPATHVQFVLHDELNKYYVKVINDETQEVIRELPSKKVMDIYAAMNNAIGILFDRKI